MKILFKYATRSRPHWFQETIQTYLSMLSGMHQYEFVITCDTDDATMNNKKMISFMKKHSLYYYFGNHKTKIEAINADMNAILDWDICVVVSDDMIPVKQDFDISIVEEMTQSFPDTDGVLHFDDGLCNSNYSKDRTITLSILGRLFYNRFGYIYHPLYKSFYCDTEFTEVAQKMKKVKFVPEVIIKHEWSGGANSKDALYRRNSSLGKLDRTIYNTRKKEGFSK